MKSAVVALLTIILLAVSFVAFAAECPLCDAAKDGNLLEVCCYNNDYSNIIVRVRKG